MLFSAPCQVALLILRLKVASEAVPQTNKQKHKNKTKPEQKHKDKNKQQLKTKKRK
jgi:hypothetical protein